MCVTPDTVVCGRVVAVVFPLQAKYLCTMRHAQVVVLGVWILSAFLALPTVFIYVSYTSKRHIAHTRRRARMHLRYTHTFVHT